MAENDNKEYKYEDKVAKNNNVSFDKKINKIWKEFLASDDRKAIDVERENDFKKKVDSFKVDL